MTKVINFTGGPGAGKTTSALEFAAHLKKLRKNVTYIPEVAYEKVIGGHLDFLDDQLAILGKQANRLYRVKDQFEWVVTDAPLFMMINYLKDANKKFDKADGWRLDVEQLIVSTFDQYDNHTFFVDRGSREFLQTGRIHNEEQSKEIDGSILKIMYNWSLPFFHINDTSDVIEYFQKRGDL